MYKYFGLEPQFIIVPCNNQYVNIEIKLWILDLDKIIKCLQTIFSIVYYFL